MTLRRFIDVAFAVLVDDLCRHGKSIFAAVEMVTNLGVPPEERVAEAEKIDNAASMNALMSALGGVKGAPV